MTTKIKPNGDVVSDQKPNTELSQTYQKRNNDGPTQPVNDPVASPKDEPVPDTHSKPFGQS